MERYLAKKREPVAPKKLRPQETEDPQEFQEEAEEFYKEKTFFQTILDRIIGEEEEGPGLFASIKSVFKDEQGDVVVEEIEVGNGHMPDDIKEVLKIVNDWLSKLSPEDMREFKQSDDYETYRNTLKKYNLIK